MHATGVFRDVPPMEHAICEDGSGAYTARREPLLRYGEVAHTGLHAAVQGGDPHPKSG